MELCAEAPKPVDSDQQRRGFAPCGTLPASCPGPGRGRQAPGPRVTVRATSKETRHGIPKPGPQRPEGLPVCLGAMMFGDRTDYAEAAPHRRRRAREAGVNFIDTADVVRKGESEKIVGKLIAADRDDWVLATKAGDPVGRGAQPARHRQEAPAAGHRPEPGPPGHRLRRHLLPAQGLRSTSRSRRRSGPWATSCLGKARYFGVSNFRGWRIAEVVASAGSWAWRSRWCASPTTTP